MNDNLLALYKRTIRDLRKVTKEQGQALTDLSEQIDAAEGRAEAAVADATVMARVILAGWNHYAERGMPIVEPTIARAAEIAKRYVSDDDVSPGGNLET